MSLAVRAIAPQTTLREVLDALRRYRVTMLPVTDENARVLGVVAQTDLVGAMLADMARRGDNDQLPLSATG